MVSSPLLSLSLRRAAGVTAEGRGEGVMVCTGDRKATVPVFQPVISARCSVPLMIWWWTIAVYVVAMRGEGWGAVWL